MPDECSFLIYALTDPRTDEIRYVGKSSSGLRRPGHHGARSVLSKDHTHKGNWLRGLVAAGLRYGVRVLEKLPAVAALPPTERRDAMDAAERRWIAHGRAEGWPLTNLTDGGDGGFFPTPEHRERLSRAMKGRKLSPEHLANLRANHARGPLSEEHKAKIRESCNRPEAIARMSEANQGRKRTPEHQAKLTASQKGRGPSPEAHAKAVAALKGKKRSPETIEKIRATKRKQGQPQHFAAYNVSEANKEHLRRLHEAARGRSNSAVVGIPLTDAHRAKISTALKGRKFSPETIERMRLGQQRRREAARAKANASDPA